MPRVTASEVKSIVPSTVLTDPQIDVVIIAANVMVNKIASNCAKNLTGDELTQTELYLSAHLVSVSDPGSSVKQVTFENASRTFNSAVSGSGILGTPYGQTANALSGGCLAQIDKRPSFVLAVGG